jgi:hypothetical protein
MQLPMKTKLPANKQSSFSSFLSFVGVRVVGDMRCKARGIPLLTGSLFGEFPAIDAGRRKNGIEIPVRGHVAPVETCRPWVMVTAPIAGRSFFS